MPGMVESPHLQQQQQQQQQGSSSSSRAASVGTPMPGMVESPHLRQQQQQQQHGQGSSSRYAYARHGGVPTPAAAAAGPKQRPVTGKPRGIQAIVGFCKKNKTLKP